MIRSNDVREFVLCLAVLGACASDTAAPTVAGISGDRRLAELSEQEVEQVCAAMDDRVLQDPQAVLGVCRLRGAAFVARRSMPPDLVMCEEFVQECLSMPRYEYCFGDVLRSCDQTVADFANCVNGSIEDLRLAANTDCETAVLIVTGGRGESACAEVMACFMPDLSDFEFEAP